MNVTNNRKQNLGFGMITLKRVIKPAGQPESAFDDAVKIIQQDTKDVFEKFGTTPRIIDASGRSNDAGTEVRAYHVFECEKEPEVAEAFKEKGYKARVSKKPKDVYAMKTRLFDWLHQD